MNISLGRRARTHRRWRAGLGFWKILALLCVVGIILLVVTPLGGKAKRGVYGILDRMGGGEPKIVEKIVEKEVIKEVPVEVIKEVPIPPPWINRKTVETGKMFNGIQVRSEVEKLEGKRASLERKDPGSYEIEFKMKINVPSPNKTLEELSAVNPNLPKILPDLSSMLTGAKVSPIYDQLYELKLRRVQSSLTRLDRILDRHNFFDTETILELTHPSLGGRALFFQSEMDVVSDGSDGDRMATLDDYISMSDYYQPFTSYGWRKTTSTPNPLLKRWEDNLKKYEEEYKIVGLPAERNRFLEAKIPELKRGIADMKARSFLIAEADPFIVISLTMIRTEGEFSPSIGDYAVVIHGDKVYPAICGDAGPTYKLGEASLRMAKEINPRATPYNRPESDLEVTYIVFPGTAEKPFTAPDLEKWHERCAQYLDKIGGLGQGFELHKWEDRFKKEEPEPTDPDPVTPDSATDPAPTTPAVGATS